jgi:hypothetical protein
MEKRIIREERIQYNQSAEQFAALNQVKAQSVRARLCRTGSYFGVVPLKLANGRLVFPAVQVKGA